PSHPAGYIPEEEGGSVAPQPLGLFAVMGLLIASHECLRSRPNEISHAPSLSHSLSLPLPPPTPLPLPPLHHAHDCAHRPLSYSPHDTITYTLTHSRSHSLSLALTPARTHSPTLTLSL